MALGESHHSTEVPVRAFLLESFPSQSQLPATSGHMGNKTRGKPRKWHEQSGALAVLLPANAQSPGMTCQWVGGKQGPHPPETAQVASSPAPGCPSLAAA